MKRVRDLWRRHGTVLALAFVGVLTLVCYGFALHLPFFRDDLPIITWLSNHGWVELWTRSSENQFYRPLAFTIYKLGRLLPSGADRVVLHGVNLILHWISAALVLGMVKLRGRPDEEAFLASVLFVVFPFTSMAIPWVTAMSHPLVTMLTLLAVVAALKAREESRLHWWVLSLLATALAPMAHESGHVCAVIVAGIVVIERGRKDNCLWRLLMLGLVLNVGALIWRSALPGTGETSLAGLADWVGNTMFSLHGLVYPVAPLIGSLVRSSGMQDFLLVVVASIGLLGLLLWAVHRGRGWRWAVSSLWWWACGMLPAVVSLRYGYNYTSPRVYALAAPGIVMVWAGLIISLANLPRRPWMRLALFGLAGGAIVAQNVAFLGKQRELFISLGGVYRRVLAVAAPDAEPTPGFVNLPASLAHSERAYAMILETVLFIPPYSNVSEFLAVNGARQADAVVFSPVVQDRGYVQALTGPGLDWDEMRRFAVDHETVWLSRWRNNRLTLDYVGSIEAGRSGSLDDPLVAFEGGAAIESASSDRRARGQWTVTIDWASSGPVDGQIFAHVVAGDGDLVMQADHPALGGMVPPWIWQPGDRIRDVRYVSTPDTSSYALEVGLFNAEGRYPAYSNGIRCPQDACSVATLLP